MSEKEQENRKETLTDKFNENCPGKDGQDVRDPGTAGVSPAISKPKEIPPAISNSQEIPPAISRPLGVPPASSKTTGDSTLYGKVSSFLTPNRGWHSRGYLPHFDSSIVIQSITFRLTDSLPANVVEAWQRQLEEFPDEKRKTEIRIRIQNYLDAGYGECLMKENIVATLIEDALLHFDGQRCRLFAWCVMPNHVHVLVQFIDEFAMSSVLHSWKSYTAKQINRMLNRKGTVWHADYFDRYIRNEKHF